MNTYNSKLQTNNTTIQELINLANNLPEAGGSSLDTLDNPGTAEDLMANKELLDAEGKKVTGTFSLDSELATNTNLISQITTALEGKAAGGGGFKTCTLTITSSQVFAMVAATIVVDGIITTTHVNGMVESVYTVTIENVLCDSIVAVAGSPGAPGFTSNGGVSVLDFFNGYVMIKAPSEAGAIGSLDMYSNS